MSEIEEVTREVRRLAAEFMAAVDQLAILTGAPSPFSTPTPMGKATAGPAQGKYPLPENGETYTPEELANPGTFTRPVLAAILKALGGDPKGKMPADIRTDILQRSVPSTLGECEFTGETKVPLTSITVYGDEYKYGDKVRALMATKGLKTLKAQQGFICKIINEEIEL